MTISKSIKKRCRFCALLKSEIWSGKESFRCSIGRFNDRYGDVYFAWSGICRTNKAVDKAESDCQHFKVHALSKIINQKGKQ